MDVVALSFTLSIMLVAAADAAGQVCGKERRSHLGLRVVVSVLSAPALLLVLTGGAALHVLPEQTSIVAFVLMILCSPALLLAPSVLYRTPDPAPGDADWGGGSDPGQPPSPPGRPNGDLPLPYAVAIFLTHDRAGLCRSQIARRYWRRLSISVCVRKVAGSPRDTGQSRFSERQGRVWVRRIDCWGWRPGGLIEHHQRAPLRR